MVKPPTGIPGYFAKVHIGRPDWADDFPKLPYSLEDVVSIRLTDPLHSCPDHYLLTVEGDQQRALSDLSVVRPILDLARHHVPKLPRSAGLEQVYFAANEDNPLWGNYCVLRPKPYTPTGRAAKHPLLLEASFRAHRESTFARLAYLASGQLDRVEINYSHGREGSTVFSIVAKLEDGLLPVTRVSCALANGQMPTLWTRGR